MAFNVLTGSISSISSILASGSFTGSFGGDGADLENVKQFDLYGVQTSGRVVLFKDVSGKTALEADTDLFYDTTTDALTTPSLTASNGISTTVVSGSGYGHFATTLQAADELFTVSAAGAVAAASVTTTGDISIGASGDLLTDQIRRSSDSSTTTKINLDDEVIKLYTGHASNEVLKVQSGIISGSGQIQISSHLSSSGQLYIPNILSGTLAGTGSYLGLSAQGSIILTSSAGGGTGTVTIANDANNRLTTADGSGGIVGEANLTFDGSVLSIQGGLILKRRQVTSTITVASTDYFIGISASSNIDINLPDASTLTDGQTFIFKDEAGSANSYTIEIKTTSPQTIDGVEAVRLESPYAAVNVYTNGSDKYFIY